MPAPAIAIAPATITPIASRRRSRHMRLASPRIRASGFFRDSLSGGAPTSRRTPSTSGGATLGLGGDAVDKPADRLLDRRHHQASDDRQGGLRAHRVDHPGAPALVAQLA